MVRRAKKIRKPSSTLSPSQKPYYEKYIASPAWQEGSGEAAFLNFLEGINISDWYDLVADLMQQRPEIWDVFRPPVGEDLLAYAAIFLNRVGSVTRRLMREAISRHVAKLSVEKISELQLVSLLSFCRLLYEPCEQVELAKLVTGKGYTCQVRLMAAQILSNQPQSLPLDYWHKIDLQGSPELLPVVISALATYSPKLALGALKEIRKRPPQSDQLEYPLRLTIRHLIKSEDGLLVLTTFLKEMPSWVRHEIQNILQLSEFSSVTDDLGRKIFEPHVTRTAIDNYLSGKIKLHEIKPEAGIEFLVEEMFSRWQPLHMVRGERRSLRLIRLASHFPTTGSIRILISALEAILRHHSSPGSVLDLSTLKIVRRALGLLAENSLLLVKARDDSSSHSQDLVTHYLRVLQVALRFREFALASFEQIVDHLQDRSALVSITRAALREEHVTPKECDRILRKFYDTETSAEILQATLIEASVISRNSNSEEMFELGAKMYNFNPAFIFNNSILIDEEDRLVMQDAAVVHTFAELASQFTEVPGL